MTMNCWTMMNCSTRNCSMTKTTNCSGTRRMNCSRTRRTS